MFRTSFLLLTAALLSAAAAETGYKNLFNGKNLDGWKITEENKETFKVKDGEIIADGSPESFRDHPDERVRAFIAAEPAPEDAAAI